MELSGCALHYKTFARPWVKTQHSRTDRRKREGGGKKGKRKGAGGKRRKRQRRIRLVGP